MAKKRIPDLHIEPVSNEANYYYLSVLQYRKEHHLVVVDNITGDSVSAYMLDRATQEGLDLKLLMAIITRWFYSASDKYPLSIEFSKLGLSHLTNRILKNFELTHVSRLVGQEFQYDIQRAPKIRRRRVSHVTGPSAMVTPKNSITA